MMPPQQTFDDFETWNLYDQLGMLKTELGDYTGAISYFQKSMQVYEKKSAINDSHLAASYTNLGLIYANLGEYPTAISWYENGLAIRQKILPTSYVDLADSYSKIGSVYCYLEEYKKALSFYEKAYEIRLNILPRNHPDLATSYRNIGVVLNNVGKYSKALQFQEKALEIRNIVLPPNHLDLADSYDNFGLIYNNMGDNLKSLSFLEKALNIRQRIQLSNHPNLADSYNNLGREIRQQMQHLNQPKLADSYNNIAWVYYKMRKYPEAVKYQKQAVKIGESSLPSNYLRLLVWKQNLKEIQEPSSTHPTIQAATEKSLIYFDYNIITETASIYQALCITIALYVILCDEETQEGFTPTTQTSHPFIESKPQMFHNAMTDDIQTTTMTTTITTNNDYINDYSKDTPQSPSPLSSFSSPIGSQLLIQSPLLKETNIETSASVHSNYYQKKTPNNSSSSKKRSASPEGSMSSCLKRSKQKTIKD
ncbi:unnamed protein product [Rotaria sp. Silwood1]|nr:unnamed protein product [Rotaria sp. Silwood1]